MLHIISETAPEIPVYFLDTGFHFPETLSFRDQVAELLSLRIVSIRSEVSKISQRDQSGQFFFATEPERCCYLNKTAPMDQVLQLFDVWISGVRRDQSSGRKQLETEMDGPHDSTRFHPMLNWNSKMIYTYRQQFDLPEHPLESQGYISVGCEPCTTIIIFI